MKYIFLILFICNLLYLWIKFKKKKVVVIQLFIIGCSCLTISLFNNWLTDRSKAKNKPRCNISDLSSYSNEGKYSLENIITPNFAIDDYMYFEAQNVCVNVKYQVQITVNDNLNYNENIVSIYTINDMNKLRVYRAAFEKVDDHYLLYVDFDIEYYESDNRLMTESFTYKYTIALDDKYYYVSRSEENPVPRN